MDGPPDRTHYRLFCVIDSAAKDAKRPYLTVISGHSKPYRTVFTKRDYMGAIDMRNEYFSREVRSLAEG